jgi:dihydroorotate dehydrogenase electron transfer subunit
MMSEHDRHIAQSLLPVIDCREIAEGIFLVRLRSEHLARHSAPGQFVNIRCGESCMPLLRRPFSISRVEGDSIELVFNVVGQGTRMLASKRPGDQVDVLGPLGRPFRYSGSFETALLVGGGLGVAPLPFLAESLVKEGKKVATFIGARAAKYLTDKHLVNLRIATDDGSKGFRGTVVELVKEHLAKSEVVKPKIFGCGPTKMLKALAELAASSTMECELSLEGDMACGIGLCQGCPVERAEGKKKYALVCVDGPTFNSNDIILR